MKTRKILLGMAVTAFVLALTGCYEKYDTPRSPFRYTDDHFTAYEEVTIQDLTAMFEDPNNTLTNILNVNVAGQSALNTTAYGKYYTISKKCYLKGRVISNDAYGNFYRGLFIMDENGDGIEVKVGVSGLYTKYPVGETVYVLCEGLVIGNYRSVLSLGLKPGPEDMSDSGDPYGNKYMELQSIIDQHVYLGPATKLVVGDTVVVKSTDAYTNDMLNALSGKLVRFEGFTSLWNSEYPSFLYKYGYNEYENFVFLDIMARWQAFREGGSVGTPPTSTDSRFSGYLTPEPKNNYMDDPQPTWGFQEYDNKYIREIGRTAQSNFGSAAFSFPGYTGSADILIRTSGFSRFAMEPITPNGKVVTFTGIVARYTDKNGGNLAYQMSVNNITDIKVQE